MQIHKIYERVTSYLGGVLSPRKIKVTGLDRPSACGVMVVEGRPFMIVLESGEVYQGMFDMKEECWVVQMYIHPKRVIDIYVLESEDG